MNRKTIFENTRNGAAVALGVAGVFGATFAVTSLVAQAAEEQTPVAVAPATPADPAVDTPAPALAPEAAPRREPERGRPPRPAFKDMDTNGDGSISQTEFEAFRPAGPPPRFDGDRPPRFEEGPPRGDWQGDERGAPRGPDRESRRERYGADDDRYAPPPPGDRYGPPPGDDRYGPPPRGRGGRGGEEFSQQSGGDCEHPRGSRPHGGPRDGYGSDDRPRPPRPPEY